MEILGIVLSVPVAFVASGVYCLLLAKVVIRFDRPSRMLWWASAVLLGCIGIEVLLVFTIGAVAARTRLGPAFYPMHLVLFFFGTPALANVLVLRKGPVRWYAAVLLCTAFALVLVLLQYGVSEALYGIDGDNGPFSRLGVNGGTTVRVASCSRARRWDSQTFR